MPQAGTERAAARKTPAIPINLDCLIFFSSTSLDAHCKKHVIPFREGAILFSVIFLMRNTVACVRYFRPRTYISRANYAAKQPRVACFVPHRAHAPGHNSINRYLFDAGLTGGVSPRNGNRNFFEISGQNSRNTSKPISCRTLTPTRSAVAATPRRASG